MRDRNQLDGFRINACGDEIGASDAAICPPVPVSIRTSFCPVLTINVVKGVARIRALQFQVVFDPTAFQVERMEPLHFPLPQINLSPANQLVIPESLMGGLELRDQAPLTELRAALLALPALQANSARSSA
jgi:hypothetical protein